MLNIRANFPGVDSARVRRVTGLSLSMIEYPLPTMTFLELYISVHMVEYDEAGVSLNAEELEPELELELEQGRDVKIDLISSVEAPSEPMTGCRNWTPVSVLMRQPASQGLEVTTRVSWVHRASEAEMKSPS